MIVEQAQPYPRYWIRHQPKAADYYGGKLLYRVANAQQEWPDYFSGSSQRWVDSVDFDSLAPLLSGADIYGNKIYPVSAATAEAYIESLTPTRA